MFFLMQCLHRPNMDAARDEHRAAHRAWVQSGGERQVSVLIGSAMLDEEGRSVGNFGILEAADIAAARAFAEGDPFNTSGIVDKIELVTLPDSFQAHRISEPMSPRLPTNG